jgi:hypothetical protein
MRLFARQIHWILLLAGFALSGCSSSTKIVNQWTDPEYRAGLFTRILVVGVSKQSSIRRTFEDRFVAKLKAQGVDAVPSYRFIPEDGEVPEPQLHKAVKQADADAALITRLVAVDKKTELLPGFYHPAPALTYGFYPGYSAFWYGYYEPPRIYQYDVFLSETSLYDLAGNRLVWSGTVQTTDPGDINEEITRYVDAVIDALKSKNILRSG